MEIAQGLQEQNGPLLVFLSGWRLGMRTEGSRVEFPSRTYTLVAGMIPGPGQAHEGGK